ncbi:N-formylglutamate amidohydrolase [uncultured Ruegeria sp.]|uniref:N-formylglutamate amidohydrolase n=1 Tax=uncultured Ruegeria sp. TaxID=259304 RepID=UPI00262C0573|nr:N-formylglutamate amidohydrolase [uncultured Ruegeria sp.]
MTTTLAFENLLTTGDPAPVEWVNRDSAAPVVLLCEHAGQAIPQKLGNLGVSKEVRASHRGWDIGAEAVARQLADRLQAPLILQRYSRLVIDCNRPLAAPDSIPPHSFGEQIPANLNLTDPERIARQKEIVAPLNAAIENMLDQVPRRLAVSIHSFTPQVAEDTRPWHAGFLTRADQATGQAVIDHILTSRPDLLLALNQPYQIDSDSDWFIPHFVEPRGLSHSLVEIRNDLIRDETGAADWAQLLADAFTGILETKP